MDPVGVATTMPANDACHAALVHDGVVEHRGLGPGVPLLVLDAGRERKSRLGGVSATHEGVERPVERLRGRRREEADPAEVHAEDRRAGAVQRAGAAQQRAVAAQGHETVEARGPVERLRAGLRPQAGDPVLGVEREPEARCDLRQMREEALEIAVARVADDPDVHEGVSDSSAASARTRAAIPSPVSPTSASCCARGACSYVRSGAPSGTTRTSGATVSTRPAR